MDRLKTFLKYALCVLGFIILSEMLINVGLNSTYKKIRRIDTNSQIEIYQAEATKVNGRMRGTIKNSQPEELSNKYIKIDFYSKRDIFLGKEYIDIKELKKDDIQSFEVLFNISNVDYYNVAITDYKEENQEKLNIPKELVSLGRILSRVFIMMVFWP